jgi:hypothetical protein
MKLRGEKRMKLCLVTKNLKENKYEVHISDIIL